MLEIVRTTLVKGIKLDFQSLRILVISRTQIYNAEGLRSLVGLTFLDISRNLISSIEPLRDMVELEYLNVSDNQLWNVDELQVLIPMTKLRRVYLNNWRIN